MGSLLLGVPGALEDMLSGNTGSSVTFTSSTAPAGTCDV